MKHLFAIFLTLAVFSTATVHARTWTSSDGSQTFEAEYVSATSKTVTVIMGGGKKTFKINKLSAADQEWINQARQQINCVCPVNVSSLRKQKIGRQLQHQTFRVKNGRFVSAKITKVPRYYYLYYAASW